MLSWKWIAPVVIALAIVVAVNVSPTKPVEAFIDEIIAALCNGGNGQGEDGTVEPPGQLPDGPSSGKGKSNSATRALLATGFITSFEFNVGDGNDTKINFDPTVPNSKFIKHDSDSPHNIPGAGNEDDLKIGVADLILSPHIAPNPAFAAHMNCQNFP